MDKEERDEFISMLRYFWDDYEDIERCTSYDEERLEKEFPEVLKVWREYKIAKNMVGIVLRGVE